MQRGRAAAYVSDADGTGEQGARPAVPWRDSGGPGGCSAVTTGVLARSSQSSEDLRVSRDRHRREGRGATGPYGHPFHPILVTVPIGAWVCSLVLDVASRATDDGAALAVAPDG